MHEFSLKVIHNDIVFLSFPQRQGLLDAQSERIEGLKEEIRHLKIEKDDVRRRILSFLKLSPPEDREGGCEGLNIFRINLTS
jgi:hypothetical protein